MARRWQEVEESEQYLEMSPQDREDAAEQYFREVVSPQLEEDDLEDAHQQFMARASRSFSPAARATRESAQAQEPAQEPDQVEAVEPEPVVTAQDRWRLERDRDIEAMSWPEKATKLLALGIKEPLQGARQYLPEWMGVAALSGEQIAQQREDLEALKSATKGGGALAFAGQLIPWLVAGRYTGGAMPLAGMTAMGAAQGALTPAETPGRRAINTLAGAAGGQLFGRAANAFTRAMSPKVSGAAEVLIRNEIPLTPGQFKPGYLGKLEEVAPKLGWIGAPVEKARAAQEPALVDAAMRIIGKPAGLTPAAGQTASEQFNWLWNRAVALYEKALPRMRFSLTDRAAKRMMGDIAEAAPEIGQEATEHLTGLLQRRIIRDLPIGEQVNGKLLLAVRRSLESAKGNDILSRNPSARRVVDGWLDTLDRSIAGQNIGNKALQAYKQGRAVFRGLYRVEQAVADSQARGGAFTASQLERSLNMSAAMGAQARRRTIAHGLKGELPELAKAAKQVLTDKLGKSPTADALSAGSMMRLIVGLGAQPVAAKLYSQPVQSAIRNAAMSGQPLASLPASAAPATQNALIQMSSIMGVPVLPTVQPQQQQVR